MENPLKHPRDEEFVQHSLRASQVLHMYDERGR